MIPIIDFDFSNIRLTDKEIKALKKLNRRFRPTKKYSTDFQHLMKRPCDFVCFTKQIGTDAFNAPIYSEEYVHITEKGVAYLNYLSEKHFDRYISVKIALASLFMSTINTVILLIKFFR